jgi:hypothetical protein
LLGDEPLDVLGAAISEVVKDYESAFGRRPTIAEWEALLLTVLGLDQLEHSCAQDGVPAEVRITARPRSGDR